MIALFSFSGENRAAVGKLLDPIEMLFEWGPYCTTELVLVVVGTFCFVVSVTTVSCKTAVVTAVVVCIVFRYNDSDFTAELLLSILFEQFIIVVIVNPCESTYVLVVKMSLDNSESLEISSPYVIDVTLLAPSCIIEWLGAIVVVSLKWIDVVDNSWCVVFPNLALSEYTAVLANNDVFLVEAIDGGVFNCALDIELFEEIISRLGVDEIWTTWLLLIELTIDA